MHPDERFLIWVGTDISPMVCQNPEIDPNACPQSERRWMTVSEYFDSAKSALNPQNRGHGFYVYGTLPMFLTRTVVQWVYGHSGFDEMTDIGRGLSAIFDLLTVLLVYLIGMKIYDRRVGLLGAAFMAFTVLNIQQSHFFTMDTFITFFTILAFYFAVIVSMDRREWTSLRRFFQHPLFLPSLFFGIALGMAVASKMNAFLMAFMLPVAMLIRLACFPSHLRIRRALEALPYLFIAAILSFLIFRIYQPYAFAGPGFFNLEINPGWLDTLKTLFGQARNLDVDFPPALQWARRSLFFSGQNLVIWGLGLPLGLLAFGGFIWAGWRSLRSLGRSGEWQQHGLIWIWTALYFGYQSLAPNPTMRYQMPVYPTLVIFAAWAVFSLWDLGKQTSSGKTGQLKWVVKPMSIFLGLSVLLSTLLWAYAFTRIYSQPLSLENITSWLKNPVNSLLSREYATPFTRVNASRWLIQNVPGAINLPIQTDQGVHNQPIPYPSGYEITDFSPYQATFYPKVTGKLGEIYLPHVLDLEAGDEPRTLQAFIYSGSTLEAPIASGSITADFSPDSDLRGIPVTIQLDQAVILNEALPYNLVLSLPPGETFTPFTGSLSLFVQSELNDINAYPISEPVIISPDEPFDTIWVAPETGKITQLVLSDVTGASDESVPTLVLKIFNQASEVEAQTSELSLVKNEDGNLVFFVQQPPLVEMNQVYQLRLAAQSSNGRIVLKPNTIATEGDWDDGLPVRIDGYDPYGGIYPQDVTFNMFWEDSPEKLDRMLKTLDSADTIAISSNRAYGTLPRIPERFPLSTLYYRHLLGCPEEKDILWCYRVARPGMFKGDLGFELVEVFQSDPQLGPLRINTQFAEEAFTVYDHPKVMIFEKTEDYDSEKVQQLLSSIDFNSIVRKPPLRYEGHPADLLLPLNRLAQQTLGGTWSELFNTASWINRSQPLSVVIWYLGVLLIGWLAFPLVRFAFPGLADGGYPLARISGLLVLSYLVWLAGSFQVPFVRSTISLALVLILAASIGLAYVQRKELIPELKTRWRYYLMVEGLFLVFFLLDLMIRLGNPDIWHPYKGGEKPMDFAYFNAVLKSTSFPPLDPWYAGGYLNYYYYGFVLFGVLVKWLGIVPSVAYNLILPTVFAMIALGAFSVAWNLFSAGSKTSRKSLRWLVGGSAALGMSVLGNLGTVRMIWQGFQRIAAPEGQIGDAGFFRGILWGLQGFLQSIGGARLPYGLGDWYWIPSRVIPSMGDVEPITEFPFFTIIYADLHAHLFALPLTLLALSFALSVVLARGRWSSFLQGTVGFLLGGLAIGALRPTNTWDFPTFLAIGVVALVYSQMVYFQPSKRLLDAIPFLEKFSLNTIKFIAAIGAGILLIGISVLLFKPFSSWYALGYTEIRLWNGPRTPLGSYFVHWGLFLFVLVSWLIWKAREWMANTPVSALRKLNRFAVPLAILSATVVLLIIFMAIKIPGMEKIPFFKGIQVTWLVLPMALAAGALLLRSDQPDSHRFSLFLIGTGLFLTLMVEILVLVGDVGRMNTVFKFYLQVWTLLAVSGAAALGWLVEAMASWTVNWRRTWLVVFAGLVFGAALFPIMASSAKIRDRMVETAPHTLDGMAYMNSAFYDWKGPMDLSQDYRAIRWMQENVQGSPVIVEANLRDLYRWGSRFSINTGLPSTVGWEWHQQQQRAINPGSWVSSRIDEVDTFYKTVDIDKAREFLQKYAVRYVIVGQLERNMYPGISMDKFEKGEGKYWNEVYRDENTVIYEVIQ